MFRMYDAQRFESYRVIKIVQHERIPAVVGEIRSITTWGLFFRIAFYNKTQIMEVKHTTR